jgi:hypothetical protein
MQQGISSNDGHKFGKVTEVDGVKYKSELEAGVARQLKRLGYPALYEATQLTYQRAYNVDLTLQKKSGGLMLIEVKGYFDKEDRIKTLASMKNNPGVDLRFVFSNWNNKVTGTKLTYKMWCDKHKLPCSSGGTVPKAWLEECICNS